VHDRSCRNSDNGQSNRYRSVAIAYNFFLDRFIAGITGGVVK
jgi:hypothetical protein